MKTLNFKLISNQKEIINQKTNCFEKDNILNFKINQDLYEIDKKKLLFKKKNKESQIIINAKQKIISIELIPEMTAVEMNIEIVKCAFLENRIEIEYIFMSEVETTNCIIIEY